MNDDWEMPGGSSGWTAVHSNCNLFTTTVGLGTQASYHIIVQFGSAATGFISVITAFNTVGILHKTLAYSAGFTSNSVTLNINARNQAGVEFAVGLAESASAGPGLNWPAAAATGKLS